MSMHFLTFYRKQTLSFRIQIASCGKIFNEKLNNVFCEIKQKKKTFLNLVCYFLDSAGNTINRFCFTFSMQNFCLPANNIFTVFSSFP